MKILKSVIVLSGLISLTACSQFEPFVDARREAGQVTPIGSSRPGYPVVCSGLWRDASERLALAEAECAKLGQTAVSVQTKSFDCKLFTPVKESFKCVPK